MKRLVLAHVTTVPETLEFLRAQVVASMERGDEVHVVSSPGEKLDGFAMATGAAFHPVSMRRRITPVDDLRSLIRLWKLFRRIRPEVVHAHTPKAGLLAMLAAMGARVPIRVYNVLGLPLLTATGFRRFALTWSERIACFAAIDVLSISESISEELIHRQLCRAEKVRVLGQGGSFGIDAVRRFNPESVGIQTRNIVRQELGIPEDAPVIGFIGRLAREKGVGELVEAFDMLRAGFPSLRLLVVGPWEVHDPLPTETVSRLRTDSSIHLVGEVSEPARYLASLDVFTLPSYREGFGTVVLEAASMGLPVVASRVPGLVDSVEDGVTGRLVAARDSASLAAGLRSFLLNSEIRESQGKAGRIRVLRDFRDDALTTATFTEYDRLRAQYVGRTPFFKRATDLVVALTALVVFSPVLVLILALVQIMMGRPAFFRQIRAGRGGKPFVLWKFRTMSDARDLDGRLLPDERRLTPLGRFLRQFSLDELPQLWNVIKGDLSLVGPRPLLMEYLPLYSAEQARRHEVTPGITGWAQIHGRNETTWDDRLERDVWYIDHRSFCLDIKILWMTATRVVEGSGTGAMPVFTGSGRGVQ